MPGLPKTIMTCLFFHYSFSGHTPMHPWKTFTDQATGTIFLYNMGQLCNMRTTLCDNKSDLCDIGSALCDMGAAYLIWEHFDDITFMKYGYSMINPIES